jgi:hypothetical protein
MIWVVASIGAFQLTKGYNLEMMSLYIYMRWVKLSCLMRAFFDRSSFQARLHTLDYETHSTSCTIRGSVGWKFQRRYHALTSHVLVVGPCLHVMTWLVIKCTIWFFRLIHSLGSQLVASTLSFFRPPPLPPWA